MHGPDGVLVPSALHVDRACCRRIREGYCAALGAWHILWGDNWGSWACDPCMAYVIENYADFKDRHPVGPACGIGQTWRFTRPTNDWGHCESDLFDGLLEDATVMASPTLVAVGT